MRKTVILVCCTILSAQAIGQELPAARLIDMLTLSTPKFESQLSGKRYFAENEESSGDTSIKIYQYRPVIRRGKKVNRDSVNRKLIRTLAKEKCQLSYQTTDSIEYNAIIESLKKEGFNCGYENDKSIKQPSNLYQHEDYTADASIKNSDNTNWYSVTFYKKDLPVDKDLHFAEDLLEFTSHEYLVYYFGENNVKKDVYYFAGNDIVNCSVLFMNTSRQVIFIWKDGLNRRKIDNLLFGGHHKLKSQQGNESFVAESSWLLKSGIYAGMPLTDLRTLNEKNIAFCGGDAANPGLIFPESTGRVDFKKADVILVCLNCPGDKFESTKIMYADRALHDGLTLFVLTIALYPM